MGGLFLGPRTHLRNHKTDAVLRSQQGEILSRIHKSGFTIVAIKSLRLTKEEAGGFYAVHKSRPFFGELTAFMSSGKIFAMVLESENAIAKWRDAMGATDPKKAAPGTIRHDLGTSIGNNCTHGSDAPEPPPSNQLFLPKPRPNLVPSL